MIDLEVKPRLRGVLHHYAFYAALAAGAVLVVLAPTLRTRFAAVVYAVALAGAFGASALYHRIDWTPRVRPWIRRLDHSMIFVLIAGTYTPFALLVFSQTLAVVVLSVVWGGALGGLFFNLVWIDAPSWLIAPLYLALGWAGVAGLPQLVDRAGVTATTLVAAGGLLYTVGAIVYACRRPNPFPGVFGFHEVFHLAVVGAAIAHYAAIAPFVVRG